MTQRGKSDSDTLTPADRRALERVKGHYLAMAAAIDIILNIGEIEKLGENFRALVRSAGFPEVIVKPQEGKE